MNNSSVLSSRFGYYDQIKIDSYISPREKNELSDSFYYPDGENMSSKKKIITSSDFLYEIQHRQDKVINLGYDYTNNGIIKKCISSTFYLDYKREEILNQIDKLFIFLANHIKSIKKTYNFLVDKNYIKIN